MHDQANVYVVMGVSGVGKTTAALHLADISGGIYVEADDFHPEENVAAMRAGTPLNDAMRAPWLNRLGQHVAHLRNDSPEIPVVIACSALKKIYRDTLRGQIGDICFVHLDADRDLILHRMSAREGHYMPVSLLDSQLATLEALDASENHSVIDVSGTPKDIQDRLRALHTDVSQSAASQ